MLVVGRLSHHSKIRMFAAHQVADFMHDSLEFNGSEIPDWLQEDMSAAATAAYAVHLAHGRAFGVRIAVFGFVRLESTEHICLPKLQCRRPSTVVLVVPR